METGRTPGHTNRLALEKSPYLLQHAHNPVDWHPWGDDAFGKARREDKPIFLSIGYSTCHWCHVMERESFENEKVAAVLNAGFVSIKLDREERPDIDKVYMIAVQAMGIAGGWPLSIWLTPDLTPFYGGTYFPPAGRFGRPGFVELLGRIAELWRKDRERILVSAREMRAQLQELSVLAQPAAEVSGTGALRAGAETFKAEFDAGHGGFGSAPKFPRPVVLRFLMRCHRRHGDAEAREMVMRTLEAMAAGGIRDHLGGGFARYSVDAEWLVPHFEKMLYDNAQLVDAYVDAIQLLEGDPPPGPQDAARARSEGFRRVVEETVAYLLEDMSGPEGAFYAAEDADSDGREGAFYVWTEAEMRGVLEGKDADFAVALFGVTPEGNFVDHSAPPGTQPPGENVLKAALAAAEAARRVGLAGPPDEAMARIRARLRDARERRPRPQRDDKILTSWNGLAIGALARAGATLDRPDWIAAARKAAVFLKENQYDEAEGRLGHAWRGGSAAGPALLDDYAFLAAGLVALYEATFEPEWLRWAERLCEEMIRRFGDADQGGFFMVGEADAILPARMKEEHDGAEPSGNSVAAQVLLTLGRGLHRPDFEEWAGRCLRLFARHIERLPQAVPNFLSALDQWHAPVAHMVLVGDPNADAFRGLAREACRVYWPDLLRVHGGNGSPLPLARELPAGGAPAAVLCHDGRCGMPVAEPAELRRLLAAQATPLENP